MVELWVENMCLDHERMGQGVVMGKDQVLAAFGLGELKEVGLSAFPTAFGLGGLKVLLEASSWCCNI